MKQKNGCEKRAHDSAMLIALAVVVWLLLAIAGALAGCRTISGLGQDITTAADGIERGIADRAGK